MIRLPTWDIEKLVVAGCSAVANSSDGLELMVKKWARGLKELDVSGTSGTRTINNAFEDYARKLGMSGGKARPAR